MANHGSFSGAGYRDTGYQTGKLRERTEDKAVKRGPMDLPFFLLTLLLLSIGVVMVLSASYASAYYNDESPIKYFVRQLLFAASGVMILLFASRLSVKLYQRVSLLSLLGSIGLLVLVLAIGVKGGGARRWINLGFTTVQPSEFAKLSVVLCFANMICVYKEKMKTFRYGVLPFGIVLAVVSFLLIKEPHLSATIIILGVGFIMMFTGGTRLAWFAAGIAVVAIGGWILIGQMGYASDRISAWKDPFSDKQGDGWQIVQSLYAIGSGGLLGTGLGQSRQKHLYLPEEHNDFIFSVVCEELGFIGAVLVIVLFALLIIRGYWLAIHARDRFGSLIITGLTTLLFLQVFLNIAVATNLVPCTGISLPFFSYGGTALWIQLIEMGIILSVSRDIPVKKAG